MKVNCMDLDSVLKFKGISYELKTDIDLCGTTVNNVRAVFKEELDFEQKRTEIIEQINQKIEMFKTLSIDTIKRVIEEETNEKIRKIKPVSISFDFADPENEECRVDVYFDCGKVFGGFTAHIRIVDNGKTIKMIGIS